MERAWGPDEHAAQRAHLVVRELARCGLIPGVEIRDGLAVDVPDGRKVGSEG
jgi:hypothetical protein